MDPNTGHIITSDHEQFEEIIKARQYVAIPPQLEEAARRKLKGRKEAKVSLTSGGKLSHFAAQERKKRKKRKRKIAKTAQRRNRARRS